MSVISGVGVGSAVGSIVPGVGTVLGGTLGGVYDTVSGLFGGGARSQAQINDDERKSANEFSVYARQRGFDVPIETIRQVLRKGWDAHKDVNGLRIIFDSYLTQLATQKKAEESQNFNVGNLTKNVKLSGNSNTILIAGAALGLIYFISKN